MGIKYFEKYKRDMFPDIQDWKGEQEQYRYMPKHLAAKTLKMKYWVFFTPTAYHLLSFSFFIVSVIIFGYIGIISGIKMFSNQYAIIMFILSAVILVTITNKLYSSIINYKTTKNFTFYDMFMREY